MTDAFPETYSKRKVLMERIARHLLWPHPALYFPIGLLRNRGNVLSRNAQVYITGFPRSGNTFARDAFVSVNPDVRIRSHRHIPTFVLSLLRRGIPGMVLIRKPLDAAISWSMYDKVSVEESIAYWNDYYSILMPVRGDLFAVSFDDVTKDFGTVIKRFNTRWRTNYTPFDHTQEAAECCFNGIEENHRAKSGGLQEMRVCRPSADRMRIKERYLQKVERSDFLRSELEKAETLYRRFLHYRKAGECRTSGRLVPEAAPGAEIGTSIEA